jgi:hypothetical protein
MTLHSIVMQRSCFSSRGPCSNVDAGIGHCSRDFLWVCSVLSANTWDVGFKLGHIDFPSYIPNSPTLPYFFLGGGET